jgi:hypothetical protein
MTLTYALCMSMRFIIRIYPHYRLKRSATLGYTHC